MDVRDKIDENMSRVLLPNQQVLLELTKKY